MSKPNIEKLDKNVKWAILIVSAITLVLLVAAALKENFLSQWYMIRLQYADILQEKATDERGKMIADNFEVQIQQAFVPTLEAVDRCVTCHPGVEDPRMKDQPQPYRTHPGDYLEHHPANKFGCTVCHRGQGRALVFEEAKGVKKEYHWDYPLLEPNLTQSSCGVCHSAQEVQDQGGAKYAYGKQLFESKGCYSCHNLHGRGGNVGPALDNEGLKIKHLLPMANVEGPHTLSQWLIEHFRDPQKIVAGSQMNPPQLSEQEVEALTVYMLSLQDRDIPKDYLSPGKLLEMYRNTQPENLTGEELYQKYCATCHDSGEYGRYDKFFKQFFPAIRGASYVQIASDKYLKANIRQGHPGTLMPGWAKNTGGLTENEIDKIVGYLKDVEIQPHERIPRRTIQTAKNPDFRVNGDVQRGSMMFNKHCAACHINGLAPDLFNPTFQSTATDGFVFATILLGRRNTAMPGFFASNQAGLTPEDAADLTTFILHSGDRQNTSSQISMSESKE